MSTKKLCRNSLAYFATFIEDSTVVEESYQNSKIEGSNPGERSGEKKFCNIASSSDKNQISQYQRKEASGERQRERQRERESKRREGR